MITARSEFQSGDSIEVSGDSLPLDILLDISGPQIVESNPVDLRFVGEVSCANRTIPIVGGMNLIGLSCPATAELWMSNIWESGFTGADNIGDSGIIWNWVNDRYELIWLVDGVNNTFNGKWYTHYEVVLGISGHEFDRNFDFSIEQNQRLSHAKSMIL